MGSNYGWSLVQCVADLASLPAFGTATAFWPQSLASRGTWDEASYRETAVTIPVQCHRSSRAAHGADFLRCYRFAGR